MLLSIVIPTKNRQHTALFAVRSAMAIGQKDYEVIVHDCSDTNTLGVSIEKEFGKEGRVKYFYNDQKPSMTENWNMAFSKTSGEYVCAIGDDDAVHPEVYAITEWLKHTNILIASHSSPVYYHWPGFSQQAYDGTFIMEKEYTGKVTVKTDLDARVKDYCTLKNPNNYLDLPEIYHCLVSQKLIDQLVNETGKVVDGTSVDIYSVIALSKYIDKYCFVDYPFTVRGASPGSNSDRFKTGQFKNHFKEYKALKMPEILPSTAGFYTTAAESVIVGCENTSQQDLLKLIDLPELYSNIAVEIPDAYEECVQKASRFISSEAELARFRDLYETKKKAAYKKSGLRSFTKWIQTNVPFVSTMYRAIFPHKHIYSKKQADDIMKAISFHDSHINKENIKLAFSSNT